MTICPTTAEDWEQAEQKKSCATGIYHCLRTQLNFLIEVCAPENTLIRPGGCPYWNINGNVDMVDCTRFSQCPDTPFLSNEVYQYPFCYQSWSTSEVSDTTTNMLTSRTVSAERSEYEHLWFFLLMVILSCVVVLLVFIIWYHLRVRRRQNDRIYLRDPEILSNGGELTNDSCTRAPLLDGQNEEEKYKIVTEKIEIEEVVIEDIKIEEEPQTPVNDGVLSEETYTQTPFLDAQKEEEKNEIVEVNEDTGFVKSDAYKEGIDVPKKEDVLIIIGSPGSGKSATATELYPHTGKETGNAQPLTHFTKQI